MYPNFSDNKFQSQKKKRLPIRSKSFTPSLIRRSSSSFSSLNKLTLLLAGCQLGLQTVTNGGLWLDASTKQNTTYLLENLTREQNMGGRTHLHNENLGGKRLGVGVISLLAEDPKS